MDYMIIEIFLLEYLDYLNISKINYRIPKKIKEVSDYDKLNN